MWTFGSVSGLSWSQIFVFSITTLFGLMISIFTLKGISGLRLGENYAYSMGINVKKTRWLILVSSAVLTASATAFVGPIAFIGLAIPHICRIAFRQTEVVKLYILVILLGIFQCCFFMDFPDFPKRKSADQHHHFAYRCADCDEYIAQP